MLYNVTTKKNYILATISKSFILSKRFFCENNKYRVKNRTHAAEQGIMITHSALTYDECFDFMDKLPRIEADCLEYFNTAYKIEDIKEGGSITKLIVAVDLHDTPKDIKRCWHIHTVIFTEPGRFQRRRSAKAWRIVPVWESLNKNRKSDMAWAQAVGIAQVKDSVLEKTGSSREVQLQNAINYTARPYVDRNHDVMEIKIWEKSWLKEPIKEPVNRCLIYFNVEIKEYVEFEKKSKPKISMKRKIQQDYIDIATTSGPKSAVDWLVTEHPVYSFNYSSMWYDKLKEHFRLLRYVNRRPAGLMPRYPQESYISVPELEYWKKTHFDRITLKSVSLVIVGDRDSGKTAMVASMCRKYSEKDQVQFGTTTKVVNEGISGWTKGYIYDDLAARGDVDRDGNAKIGSDEALSFFNTLTESGVRYVGGTVEREAFVFQILTFNPDRLVPWKINDAAIAKRTFILWYMHPGEAFALCEKVPEIADLMFIPEDTPFVNSEGKKYTKELLKKESIQMKIKVDGTKGVAKLWAETNPPYEGTPWDNKLKTYQKLLRVGDYEYRKRWKGIEDTEELAEKAIIVVSRTAYKLGYESTEEDDYEERFKEWTGIEKKMGLKKEKIGEGFNVPISIMGKPSSTFSATSLDQNFRKNKWKAIIDVKTDDENYKEDPDRWAFLGSGEYETHNYTDSEDENTSLEEENEK